MDCQSAAVESHAGIAQAGAAPPATSGFEWTGHLVAEPRRLSRRFLRNNPQFAVMSALQLAACSSGLCNRRA